MMFEVSMSFSVRHSNGDEVIGMCTAFTCVSSLRCIAKACLPINLTVWGCCVYNKLGTCINFEAIPAAMGIQPMGITAHSPPCARRDDLTSPQQKVAYDDLSFQAPEFAQMATQTFPVTPAFRPGDKLVRTDDDDDEAHAMGWTCLSRHW